MSVTTPTGLEIYVSLRAQYERYIATNFKSFVVYEAATVPDPCLAEGSSPHDLFSRVNDVESHLQIWSTISLDRSRVEPQKKMRKREKPQKEVQ
ncbi:hypothetical protein EVAR_71469_1 [Eumeta japonica]|uniref:Uncharacterized protein n=1 Tax=Eumeta variegata TaxID=151549 RepID=A0A4C1SJ32_EUMVA|nr:hypothetical protein EVAR_71469_1 [Eumeta japonica]